MADKLHPERAYECKGRIRPTRKGKSFCWRIKKAEFPGDFEVQFHSLRTGKLIGYLAPEESFTTDRKKAKLQFYGYKINAEFQLQSIFRNAQEPGRAAWTKRAKDLVKKVKKEAEKKK